MMGRMLLAISAAVLAVTAAGCTTMIGDKPSDVPPRLAGDPDKASSHIWDRPEAFGPVPADLVAKGNSICATMNTGDKKYQAVGYHPKAIGIDGRAIPGGGYFCE